MQASRRSRAAPAAPSGPKDVYLGARLLAMLATPPACPACFWLHLRCRRDWPFHFPAPSVLLALDRLIKEAVHREIEARGRLPDVVAVCAERVRTEPIPELGEAVTNPTVLVEVLSEKTATTDHEAKLQEYLALPSVVEYWVVNPEAEAFVMQYRKAAAHAQSYRLTLYTALEAELLSDELGGLRIPIRAIYDQVERTP